MKYAAFISYSHHDRRWAEWLHRAIEAYRPPKGLAAVDGPGESPAALKPVFLDRAELPSSSDLAGTVRAALEESAALIVICSAAAAQSRWVNEEVRAFKALGRGSRIFCLVVEGEPVTGECFPPALRYEVQDGTVTDKPAGEPLAADVRPGKDDRTSARLKIVAGLLGVPLDRLRQRELARRQRRLAVITAVSVAGCVAFGALAFAALRARTEAERQRLIAEQQALTARRTADFMKSLFAVADPSEARGNSITAREVLDRGARQIESQLKDTPLVRADLTTTLGEVYASLGLYNESMKLLGYAAAIPAVSPDVAARTLVAFGELQYERGDYAAALSALGQATRALGTPGVSDASLQMRALSTFADVYYAQDNISKARHYFEQVLALASRQSMRDPSMRARAFEGIAQADLSEKQFDTAATGFQKALTEQLAATGELHPRVSEIFNQLGSLEYLRGRPTAAIPYFRRCLAIDRKIFGTRHPSTSISLNNLARLLLEQRQFAEANTLLSESVDSRTGQMIETGDRNAFLYANLAIVRMGLNDLAGAEPLFQMGLKAAIANKHRLHGPILTDLADLECRNRKYEQGLKRLDEARPIVAARYPDDPWRIAHVDNVRAGCLVGLKRYGEAERLIESSLPVILKKWPPDSLFGHDALERTMRLYGATGNASKLAQYRHLAQSKSQL
jgi:tetratricopeptide (TPR) repeat protein